MKYLQWRVEKRVLMVDHLIKMTKSNSNHKTLHGTPVFAEKGYFEEESLDIGDKNNVLKVSVPTVTAFYVNQCRQTQKDLDKDIIFYVDMKVLAQVNSITDPTPKEIEETMNEYMNEDPESDFVMCTYPGYKGDKLLGITEELSCITVLGDRQNWFFDNGFAGEKKDLWSDYERNKMRNPFSCTIPSFIKTPIKESHYDTSKRCEIYCYTPQLCDCIKKANQHNKQCSVPFIEVRKESFGENFYPADLLSCNPEKKAVARKTVVNIAKLMVRENKERIIRNFDNKSKHLPSDPSGHSDILMMLE